MSTMRQVAALAGVSAKTVSRVLNDDPHVHAATRARVTDAMRELAYVPNDLAQTFRTGRAPVIGVVVPDIVDPFFAAIVHAVEQTALARGMSTLVTSVGDDPARERPAVESLLRRQLSGLVVAPTASELAADDDWLTAAADRTPVVFVDRVRPGGTVDAFVQNDRGGAALATAHLVAHGHRRIAFVSDDLAMSTIAARREGWADALATAGADVDEALVSSGEPSRDGVDARLRGLLALANPPTAVFSADARTTIALVPSLVAHPLALVGFGDFPLADMLRPAISVIAQNPDALGRLAAQRILARLDRDDDPAPERTELPVHLVERDSCRVAPPTPGLAPGFTD